MSASAHKHKSQTDPIAVPSDPAIPKRFMPISPADSNAKITFSETLEAMFLLPVDLHLQLVKDRTWITHSG